MVSEQPATLRAHSAMDGDANIVVFAWAWSVVVYYGPLQDIRLESHIDIVIFWYGVYIALSSPTSIASF